MKEQANFNEQLKQQYNLMLIALTFFTRIPIRSQLDFSQSNLNRASRYFSLIGWLVGLICGLFYWFAGLVFPDNIAIILSMLVGVFLTGSFHEDGLVDTCDGFGGGWQAKRKLEIMKDSRIGTYGAVAIWFTLSLKFLLLTEIESVVIALLIAHPLSRAVSSGMIYLLPYVMDDEKSKIKPLAEKQHFSDLMVGLAIGAIGLLMSLRSAVMVVVALIVLVFFLRWLFVRQIGGFTGDTLGATQQLSEMMIYLVLVASGASE